MKRSWQRFYSRTVLIRQNIYGRKKISVKDIMSGSVISVHPSDSVVDAAKVIAEHNFDGVPVVDENDKLVGIVTEYDLVTKGPAIHLPTFQFLLQNLSVFREDRSKFKDEAQTILNLRVSDVMNLELEPLNSCGERLI